MAAGVSSVYDFKVKDSDGKAVNLGDKYRGKVLIIVNVASECGLTNSNYTQLKVLLDKYKSKGLEVAAFPCNQFGGQEPACELDIKNFVQNKFNFEPDLYSKVDGGFLIDAIKWNFTKFLVDREGNVVKRYGPKEEPHTMEDDIKKVLDGSKL
ncbi:hypothetical protein WR25_01438 [Diploscapter pachys]|uniref:Glutathione peroxidase n=1 Tax=Diploscapter pachys TaxID=2018661 RepID=A0A2A2JP44_9BILA|nr:hypothetical protein WR25_01438 [Diploscapter pachys]